MHPLLLTLATLPAAPGPMFADATESAGLAMPASRVCVADLNDDGHPDAVLDRVRVFLNRTSSAGRVVFEEVGRTGLPAVQTHDVTAFADLDNDRLADAILGRSFDPNNPQAALPPEGGPQRSCWLKGNGDGTFGGLDAKGEPLGAWTEFPVEPTAVACVAVGDANRDGLPDVALGNWYTSYGHGYDASPTHLLLQRPGGTFERAAMPDDGVAFSEADAGGRPTYGILLVDLLSDGRTGILELNYGRRANRYIVPVGDAWADLAPTLGLDGDEIRHGRYPDWVKERGREDELPFRSHGNTFDAAVADVNRDGLADLFLAEITHGWAGDSSDRSRLLLRAGDRFAADPAFSTDRAPPDAPSWNQGDLFAAFLDADLDAFPDLLLSSGDYPDPEPHAQRLRLFRNTGAGFADLHATPGSRAVVGFDHRGSAQLALADFDADGDEDVLVAQSFHRLDAEQRAAVAHPGARDAEGNPAPSVRLFLNQAVERGGRSIALRLRGERATRWAYGAVVRATIDHDADPATPDLVSTHWLNPVGGHAGKSNGREVVIGLGAAASAEVTVTWPDGAVQPLGRLQAGRHEARQPERGSDAGGL